MPTTGGLSAGATVEAVDAIATSVHRLQDQLALWSCSAILRYVSLRSAMKASISS